MEQPFFHKPVLLQEAVDYLVTNPDGVYVDCTLGGAGHAEAILKKLDDKGILVCLDADADSIQHAEKKLASFSNKIIRKVSYSQLDIVLLQENLLPAAGIIFDLGISSFQVDEKKRGFSFQEEGPLDMRFDRDQPKTAAQVVNEYPREELERIFRDFGEERQWRRIAKYIVANREKEPIRTTKQLADIVRWVTKMPNQAKSLARIFQAVRIETNNEYGHLNTGLEKAFNCLKNKGRIVCLAYHSLEDRMVKEFFRYKELDCICPPEFPECVCDKEREMRILTRRPVTPSPAEIDENPRARSAKMRAAEKIVDYRGLK